MAYEHNVDFCSLAILGPFLVLSSSLLEPRGFLTTTYYSSLAILGPLWFIVLLCHGAWFRSQLTIQTPKNINNLEPEVKLCGHCV